MFDTKYVKNIGNHSNTLYYSSGEIKIYSSISDELLNSTTIKYIKEKCFLYKKKVAKNEFIDASEFVGILSEYKLIYKEGNFGGYCDYTQSEIAINFSNNRDIMSTLCHEIAHAFQAELEIFDKLPNLLSANISMEQQCETMAYYIYNILFPFKPLSNNHFNAYYCKNDFIYLYEYYGGFLQNDMKLF
jgi:Zn-dependent peptidase ImmA (M78 family)